MKNILSAVLLLSFLSLLLSSSCEAVDPTNQYTVKIAIKVTGGTFLENDVQGQYVDIPEIQYNDESGKRQEIKHASGEFTREFNVEKGYKLYVRYIRENGTAAASTEMADVSITVTAVSPDGSQSHNYSQNFNAALKGPPFSHTTEETL